MLRFARGHRVSWVAASRRLSTEDPWIARSERAPPRANTTGGAETESPIHEVVACPQGSTALWADVDRGLTPGLLL